MSCVRRIRRTMRATTSAAVVFCCIAVASGVLFDTPVFLGNGRSAPCPGEARSKYVSSTCYFVGPVIAAPLRNPAFQAVLQQVATARLAYDAGEPGS
ncbi:hypothetical protein WJX81_000457 [Elliptochloris bilobata]|uniref:Uncharacterized protein n=1 Tax=Elliptochloris bilobata TaxID=381761 RepID=A0AAW1QY78_9CHLO